MMCLYMISKPTFHCCMVGPDIFKQPVSINLSAEAEYEELNSVTLGDSTSSSFPTTSHDEDILVTMDHETTK